MSNLRFVERDGKMVLQERVVLYHHDGYDFWQDVPTHKEPKKVSVEDELAEVLNEAHNHAPHNQKLKHTYAKAAIEFFKTRMPESLPNHYYHEAIKDVRKALFGEE